VGVAGRLAAQRLALAFVGHLQPDTGTPGQPGDLLARHFQQPAVGGVGDGLLLGGGVDDHALELGLLDRTHRHCRLDSGLEQRLDAGFAESAPEAADLRDAYFGERDRRFRERDRFERSVLSCVE
jgi:hypothetical protein